MTTVLVDTSVLVDALLKAGPVGDSARKALKRSGSMELPDYAIKELKLGALRNWILVHNRLLTSGSVADVLDWIGRNSRRSHLQGTAIEALRDGVRQYENDTTPFSSALRTPAEAMSAQVTRMRVELRLRILIAWRSRRKGFVAIAPLPCYRGDVDLLENPDGTIDTKPHLCDHKQVCGVARLFLERREDVARMAAASELQDKAESRGRARALRSLLASGSAQVDHVTCRSFGDAVFAFLCRGDCAVLTSNTTDHAALVSAVGRSTVAP